MHTKIKATIRS